MPLSCLILQRERHQLLFAAKRPYCVEVYSVSLIVSFPLQNHSQAHDPQHHGLQPRMLTQHNGHISYAWYVPSDTPNDILFAVEIALSASVEFRIISHVIIAFCQESF